MTHGCVTAHRWRTKSRGFAEAGGESRGHQVHITTGAVITYYFGVLRREKSSYVRSVMSLANMVIERYL